MGDRDLRRWRGVALRPAEPSRSAVAARGALARPDGAVAALVLAACVLVYLWPVLVGGKILSPLTLLYAFPPWRAALPAGAADWYNPLLIDVPAADYPWRWLVRELLHGGTFPAWNPHALAGTPLYGNPQTGLFSLFSLPLWLLPLNYGIGVGAALKLWAGGFGTYLLARELRLGLLPGLLAGVCFGFSAFQIVWLTHETLPAVVAMLPWAIWLIERICRGGRLGCALGLAAVTAIGLGGGHPGMQVHLMAVLGLYAALRTAFMTQVPARERLRALAVAYGAIVLGALLMAFMLLPELLSSRGTIGTFARSHVPAPQMPFRAIWTVAFPDWWGRPGGFEASRGVAAAANFNERTFYAGTVALLLAVVGLLSRDAWRSKAPFVVLGVVGLAVPLHAPGLYALTTHLPALNQVGSQRIQFVFAFAVALLAGFGLQALLDRPRGERVRLLVPLAALVLAGVALWRSGAQAGDAGRTVRHFLTGVDYANAGVLTLTAAAWYALFALGAGLALVTAWRWPRHRRTAAVVVVLLAMADAYRFAHGFQPMGPESKVVPPRTPAVAFLQQHADEGRVLGLGGALLNDASLIYGLDDIRGYDPPQPTLRFYRLWLRANPSQLPWRPFWIEELSPRALRVASVLGARYVVTAPEVTALPASDAASRPLTRVYGGEDAAIFRNPNAPPRAFVAPSVALVSGERQTRDVLTEPGFDPLRGVVVERDQPGVAALAGAGPAGDVAIVRDENARVTLRATLSRRGLVVLNDNWAAGWTVRVDGKPAALVRANDVMRGVAVGPGRHEVVWSYSVPGLRAGVAVTLVALALWLAGLLVRVRTRTPLKPAEE